MKNIIEAIPLELMALDTQIQKAGGRGYNSDVVIREIKNSFSCYYTFETEEGQRTIKTQNTFTVGNINDGERHIVKYMADDNEYVLLTPKETKKGKVLLISSLGFDFETMMVSLRELWPNRLVWNLTNPSVVID